VTLAAIVEKETSKADERARVAGVFYNRLKKGMPLQSDPTVIFAVTLGKLKLGRGLTYDDLKIDSPYNTYLVKGPAARADRQSGPRCLQAVLRPMKHKEYYFVADGTGGHAFAETLAQHNKNVAGLAQGAEGAAAGIGLAAGAPRLSFSAAGLLKTGSTSAGEAMPSAQASRAVCHGEGDPGASRARPPRMISAAALGRHQERHGEVVHIGHPAFHEARHHTR